jgi:general secretion pathway protein K
MAGGRAVNVPTQHRRQRGVALLVALLVVALATVLIAGLIDRGELGFARTRNQLLAAQAQAYAEGLETYAARVLLQDWATNGQSGNDSNSSVWAVPLPPTPVPNGLISATMSDRNGCFNLNNLVDASGPNAPWPDKFRRLLNALRLDPNLADAVVAWMNTQPGVEDPYYLAQPVPYREAKRGFVHVSELRLVKGVSGNVYAALAPHVCALPPGTRINVNTASAPVLMTLDGVSTLQIAQRIWQEGHANYSSLGALTSIVGMPPDNRYYSVRSTYFLARGDMTLDGLPFTFYSLIERRLGAGGNGGIRVIGRSRGGEE